MIQTEFQMKLVGQLSDLKAFSRRYTADKDESNDLVQETIFKALRFWTSFKDGTNFSAWLHMIMRNTFIDRYQYKKRRKYEYISEEVPPKEVYKLSTYNAAEPTLDIHHIKKVIRDLGKEYSVPISMFFEGYRYHEIADHLSVPISTVKTRIHVARKVLKKKLEPFKYYAATA